MGSRGLRVGSHLGAGDGDPLKPVLAHEVFESQFQTHFTPAPTRAWAACASTGQWHLGEKKVINLPCSLTHCSPAHF